MLRGGIISRGIVESNFYDALIDQNFDHHQLFDIDQKKNRDSNSFLASKLYNLLIEKETHKECFNNLSKIIILDLCVPNLKINSYFLMKNNGRLFNEIIYEFENILKLEHGYLINNYFKSLEKISTLLKDCQKLSNKQKLDYCSIERLLMKLYLKDMQERIEK